MATAGSINIFVNAVTKNFDAGISNVHKQLRGLTKGFADISGALNIAQQAFGKVSEVVTMLSDELIRLDKIGDLAARFDVTAESVQKMQRAIQLSGGEVESLSRVLGKMQNVLGDAVNGNSGAVGAFKRLGLSAEALSGLSIDDSFERIVRAISKMPNAASRAAAATDIFGKASVEMLEIFTRENVFEDAAKDVKDFGTQLDETRLNSIEKATEAFNRMKMASDAARGEAAIASAPTLTFLARAEANLYKGISENGILSTLLFMQRDIALSGLSALSSPLPESSFTPPAPPRLLTPDSISLRTTGQLHSLLAEYGQLVDSGLALNPKELPFAQGPNFIGGPFNRAFLQQAIGIDALGTPGLRGATGGAAALEFGSTGAFSAIQQSKREDEMRKLQKQEVEETKKINTNLEKILDAGSLLFSLDLQG